MDCLGWGASDFLVLGFVLLVVDASGVVFAFDGLPHGGLVLDQETDHPLGSVTLLRTALGALVGQSIGDVLCKVKICRKIRCI